MWKFYFSFAVMSLGAGSAFATELNFLDDSGSVFSSSDISTLVYGDRVASAIQDGFMYGPAGGWTPNVEMTWSAQSATWGTGYGDLSSAVWKSGSGSTTPADDAVVTMRFDADAGYMVKVLSFNLADWSNSTQVPTTVTLKDGGGNLLFSWSGIPDTNTHTSFDTSSFEASSLILSFNNGWHTGMGDIIYAQTPEPGIMVMAGLAGLALLRKKKSA